jgi:hypothetical protein
MRLDANVKPSDAPHTKPATNDNFAAYVFSKPTHNTPGKPAVEPRGTEECTAHKFLPGCTITGDIDKPAPVARGASSGKDSTAEAPKHTENDWLKDLIKLI